jgi:hypothetical protein
MDSVVGTWGGFLLEGCNWGGIPGKSKRLILAVPLFSLFLSEVLVRSAEMYSSSSDDGQLSDQGMVGRSNQNMWSR